MPGIASENLRLPWVSRLSRAAAVRRSPLDDTVLPCLLRLVERLVGSRNQIAPGNALAHGQTDTRRRPQFGEFSIGRPELFNPLADALRHRYGILRAAAGHDDGELLAAEAGTEIKLPNRALQDVANTADDEVAGQMAEPVVNALEVVDVDHEQRHRGVLAAGSIELLLEAFVKVAAVE